MTPEELARLYHRSYEDLAPEFNYKTKNESKKPWEEVPENNRQLMIAAARRVLRQMEAQRRVIDCASECHLMDEHEQLKKDFIKYARHMEVCENQFIDSDDLTLDKFCPCDCGLKELLQGLRKQEGG